MYHMRGNRVSPMQEEEIAYKAINFCNAFGIAATKRKRKRYDLLFMAGVNRRCLMPPGNISTG